MLVLNRKIGETLKIGDDIVITVLATKGNQVRIGIEAPRHISVHREEIYQRIAMSQHNDSNAGSTVNGI